MRTFEEIKASVITAVRSNDAEVLLLDATELDSIPTPEAKALADRSRGSAHSFRGDYSGSLEHYQRARAIYEEIGDRSGVALVTNNIGIVLNKTGNYTAALEHHHRALAIYAEIGEHIGSANTTGDIGIVYHDTGNFPAALEYFHRALALYEELGNRSGVAMVTGNIGNVHSATGNYPAALEHHHRALALHEELGNRSGAANVNSNIGIVHNRTGNYSSAIEYDHRALTMYEELEDRSGMARVTGNIGNVHWNANNYTAALENFYRALAWYEELGERRGVARVTGNILSALISSDNDTDTEALLQKMDAMQIDDPSVVVGREMSRASLQERAGNKDKAIVTLVAALEIARKHSLLDLKAQVHKALRDLAQKRNDFAAYIEHNNEFTRITEEINGKDTATKLAMQEAEKKMAKERNEHEKHLAILHSTLPKHIADRVARGEVVNDHHDNAAVIFLDIVGFTAISDQLSSTEVVQLLESVFTALDDVCEKHNVVKIKTIGDSYMAVVFPQESSNSEQRVASIEERAANAALDMLQAVTRMDIPTRSPDGSPERSPLQVRIGIHCGAVTAGVIGTARMQYDVWGDTVNVASRMESTGEAGRIHVSSSFALALEGEMAKWRNGETAVIPSVSEEQRNNSPFPIPHSLRERGALEIKGKGTMQTYWLESAS